MRFLFGEWLSYEFNLVNDEFFFCPGSGPLNSVSSSIWLGDRHALKIRKVLCEQCLAKELEFFGC